VRIKTNAPAENNPRTRFYRVQVLLPDCVLTLELFVVVSVCPDTAMLYGGAS
jgi:hypothetical protein